MAGYWQASAQPGVLAELLIDGPRSGGHQPLTYEYLVAAAPAERAVRLTCACGVQVERAWTDGVSDYRSLLAVAWAEHRR